MKTPDEIKKGLRCPAWVRNHHLPCSECDYHGREKPPCAIAVHEDAFAYIQQLEAERDAAVKDLEEAKDCINCKHECGCKAANYDCRNCNVVDCPCKKCQYEWRGVQKEE